ncbi:MAG: hypothetical protein IJ496_08735 [Ruminococcus sp.]|nr:hypothetical protein [Ruminococcus sp.]
MKKKWLLLPLICLMLSMLLSLTGTLANRTLSLNICQDLCTVQDGLICGIDYNVEKQQYHIYRCTTNGRETSSIPLSAEQDRRRYVYDFLIYDAENEQVYVHVGEYGCVSGLIEREEIFLCDFENRKLEPAWEIAVEANENPYPSAEAAYIKEGRLYYLYTDWDTFTIYRSTSSDHFLVDRKISLGGDCAFSSYSFDSAGRLSAFSTYGGLYTESIDGVLRSVLPEGTENGSYVNLAWGETYISYLNLHTDSRIRCHRQDGIVSERTYANPFEQTVIDGIPDQMCVVEPDMLSNIWLIGESSFAAYAERPEVLADEDAPLASCLAVYDNGRMTLYPELHYTGGMLLKRGAIWLGASFLVFMLLGLAVTGIVFFYKKRKYISVRIEIVIFAVMLFGSAIGLTGFEINRLMTRSFNESYADVFDDLEKEIRSELNVLFSETEGFSEEMLFSEAFHSQLDVIMQNTLIENHETGEKEFAPYFVFHVCDSEGNLIMLYNSSGKEWIPTSYVYNNYYMRDVYDKVLENGISRNMTQYDTEGTWNVQLCYYENEEYGIEAVIEIGIDQYLTDWKTRQITSRIVQYIVILCSVMVLAVIVYIGFALLPIRRLGLQVEKGLVNRPGRSRRSAEVMNIWERLYVMIQNVKSRQQEMQENNEQHYRFVPLPFVQMLRADSLEHAVPGTRRKSVGTFAELRISVSSTEALHRFYQIIIPWLEEQGCIVYRILSDRLSLLLSPYPSPEQLSLVKYAANLAKMEQLTVGIGMGNGTGLITVSGAESCASVMVASVQAEAAERAAGIAQFFGCRGIVTEQMKTVMTETGWYCRKIGTLCQGGEKIVLYELLDAFEDTAVCGCAESFEQAAELMAEGKFSEAYGLFKSCLAAAPQDILAEWYAEKCRAGIAVRDIEKEVMRSDSTAKRCAQTAEIIG